MNKNLHRQFPLVSIVMPTYNQAGFIEASLESIFQQGYPALEILVMDGHSTDRTADVVAKIQQKNPCLQFHSRADNGPAQALNRGLNLAKGSIIGWLNSDDLYGPEAIFHAVSTLMQTEDCLMVYGRAEHIDETGHFLSEYPTISPDQVSIDENLGCFICQPTVFFRHTMQVLLGEFNEQLKTAFDFEYWMRAFQRFPDRICYCELVSAKSRLHAGCITRSKRSKVIRESMSVVAHYAGQVSSRWLSTYANEVSANIVDETERQMDLLNLVEQFQAFVNPADMAIFKTRFLVSQ